MTTHRGSPPEPGSTTAHHRHRDERGSVTLEMVIAVVPLAVMLLLLTTGFIRQAHVRDLVDQAAQQAARAASLGPGYGDTARASQAASLILAGTHGCSTPRVSLTRDPVADAVTADVSCTVGLGDLFVAGFPGHQTISASATSPRDVYAPGGTP
ncbi:TadE/TadG family type IV pilus assembly protein [Actinospica robiniae]|uniref:TadE/TadG family type IV pilus assembly protein n=1 Tax=Actinospica robiniae TaxID=304901 RepID=UPI000412B7A1|nr:TadE/TadG family type IV pilus assembly protein [Actinospica robiniae]